MERAIVSARAKQEYVPAIDQAVGVTVPLTSQRLPRPLPPRRSAPEPLRGQAGTLRQRGNFSQATLGCVSLNRTAKAANPQSAPAMTFSRPTSLANRSMRSGDQLGMLHQVGSVADDAGDEDPALGCGTR
jgi:hypothetical protein